ncbi:HEL212Wp [Eremothecium sinecaudum]|uniref:Conserved oligomeric Golgi complex subunit 6 n=1 Tax=Eremothecium sinecaudum TaxID=45286 RepID=A0A0X8HTB4_9SACH|nr:HEL212Wp [Eremothecium sinecaudum]AMD21069.1 HEL212Wp [Eremothecium sinecaudum]
MDFLEYQTFNVGIPVEDEINVLPEPASSLPLIPSTPTLSSGGNFSSNEVFNLPDLENAKFANDAVSLNDRMQKYAARSIELLPRNAAPLPTTTENGLETQQTDFNQLLKTPQVTNSVLTKRLSRVLSDVNHPNYQLDLRLRKALSILQENQHVWGIDSENLIKSEFIGSLARKSFKSDIERQLLDDHLTVLEHFQPIARRIKRYANPVKNILDLGNKVVAIQKSNEDSLTSDPQVDSLRKQLENLKLKRKILIGIRDNMTLNQVEDEQLSSGVIDDQYFKLINKLMAIKERATYLISLSNPMAGKALLEKVNNYLQYANKRIYNYLMDFLYEYESMSKTFGERNLESKDSTLGVFQDCLIYLSNDLKYFNDFLAAVVSLRSKKLFEEFLSQFDIENKKSKPIILSAHDPARYLGDVLAYVHSVIANEADFLKSLFTLQHKELQDKPKSILQENGQFFENLDTKVLNDIINSLSNPTRIRLEQTVRFEEDALINFDMMQLLELYQMMFMKHGLDNEGKLVKVLKDLAALAKSRIVSFYSDFLDGAAKEAQPTTELLPPSWIVDYISYLCDLFDRIEHTTAQADILNEEFFDKLVLQPCKTTFFRQAESWFPLAKKNLIAKFNLTILKANTFDMIVSRLVPYHNTIFSEAYAHDTYDSLNNMLETLVTQLNEVQTRLLFESTGMILYYNLFNMIFPVSSVQDQLDYDMYTSVIENPIMNLDTIEKAVQYKLKEYLPQALMDVQEIYLFNLTSPKIANSVASTAFTTFAKFYSVFRNVLFLLFPNDEDRIKSILSYSEDDVNMLLGIN